MRSLVENVTAVNQAAGQTADEPAEPTRKTPFPVLQAPLAMKKHPDLWWDEDDDQPAPAQEVATKPAVPPEGSTLRELIVWYITAQPGVHDIASLMVVCKRDYLSITRALDKLVQQNIVCN